MKPRVKRILVAISGSCRKVTREVAEIATRLRADVQLCTVLRPIGVGATLPPADRLKAEQLRTEAARIKLDGIAALMRAQGVKVTLQVERNESVTDGLLHRIDAFKPDLVAIEAHKHNAIARLLLNQNDFSLIRYCPVPLLIVKNGAGKQSRVVQAAVDPWAANGKPASLDSKIVDTGRYFSKALDIPLHSAHVYRPLVGFLGDAMFAPVAIPVSLPEERRYVAKIKQQFCTVNSKFNIGARQQHLKMGDPAFTLPRIARSTGARMVVMGAVSRKIIKRALIGSTAERVLEAMPCNILVVKPDGFRADEAA